MHEGLQLILCVM